MEREMKAFITVGMGFGDEGKGSVVDFLCREHKADLVCRYNGGCQAAHNVVLPDGRHHTFRQFGSGTLSGVPTYIGKNVIIDPIGLETESAKLSNICHISNPKRLLYIHKDSLVTTPWHMCLNRLESLQNKKKDSCLYGIGKTREYQLQYAEDAVYAHDCMPQNIGRLVSKLTLIRSRFLNKCGRIKPADKYQQDELKLLYELSPSIVAGRLCKHMEDVALTERMPNFDVVVMEGAQGVLLDEWYGFNPNTTWSTTTTLHAGEELNTVSNVIHTEVIGVIRAYFTRHGNGPLPTYNPTIEIEELHNRSNVGQGDFRFGDFDDTLFHYSEDVCPIHSVFVTCLDHLPHNRIMRVAKYNGDFLYPALPSLSPLKNSILHSDPRDYKINEIDLDKYFDELDMQVYGKSFGPTYKDKTLCI